VVFLGLMVDHAVTEEREEDWEKNWEEGCFLGVY
jgi:hypothetical protein